MVKFRWFVDMFMFINIKRMFMVKELVEEFGFFVWIVQCYLLDLSELGLFFYSEKGWSGGYRVLKNCIFFFILFIEEEVIFIFFVY